MTVQQGATDPPDVLERFHAQLSLVDIIAAQIARSIGKAVEFDDLLSAGREGLLDAARRFDETRGVPFRAFANLRVRGAVIDSIRRQSPLSRKARERLDAHEAAYVVSDGEVGASHGQLPPAGGVTAEQQFAEQLASMATAAALAMSSKAAGSWPLSSDESETPEEQLSQAELFDLLRRNIDELHADEAAVIRAYYFESKSFSELAEDLNFSKSWACRLHTRAIQRLTYRMRGSL